ncbi:hypothetical protein Nmel_014355 [Mimus melanotis]
MPMSVFIQALGELQGMGEMQKRVRRGRCYIPDLDCVATPLAKASPVLQAPLEIPDGHERFAAALLRWVWFCGPGHFQQVLAVAVPSVTGGAGQAHLKCLRGVTQDIGVEPSRRTLENKELSGKWRSRGVTVKRNCPSRGWAVSSTSCCYTRTVSAQSSASQLQAGALGSPAAVTGVL